MSQNQFFEASHLSDAVLVVEGKRLHVSKTVLSLASPVFDRMFHGYFKEGKDRPVIPLPGKKYDHMVEFLSCIYPSSDKAVTRENMDVVMPLAEEYQVSSIKETCDTLIETIVGFKNPPSTDLVHLLFIAGKYGLSKSMEKCAEVACTRKLRDLQNLNEFGQVDPEMRYRVASRRLLRYESGCNELASQLSNIHEDPEYCSHFDSDKFQKCLRCRGIKYNQLVKQLKSFHPWN